MLHEPEADDSLFSPGSPHLQHLAQFGAYLNRGHAAMNTTEYLGLVALHWLSSLGAHIIINNILDLDYNFGTLRWTYRDGISRAFQYREPLQPDDEADRGLGSMRDVRPSTHRPFWIINMQISLIDDDAQFKNRTGDAFELTPRWAGADAVGYVETTEKPEGSGYWMQPLRGVAISGAAIDHEGIELNPVISKALELANLNLGYYVDSWADGWLREDPGVRRTFCRYLPFYTLGMLPPPLALASHQRTISGKRYKLTDGGHFDNLGIYALIRRGCRLIIVSDATQDTRISSWDRLTNEERALTCDDLREVELKLHADFGAAVKIRWRDFSPRAAGRDDGDRFGDDSPRTVIFGEIRNLPVTPGLDADDDLVRIVYIRAAGATLDARLRESLTFIDREAVLNSDFPNDGTEVQDYPERRVYAYQTLAHSLVLSRGSEIIEAVRATERAYRGRPAADPAKR
jgi:hypothetical protein